MKSIYQLTAGYLSSLRNADHIAVVHSINDRAAAFETENADFIAARSALNTAYNNEDDAYHAYSKKDFVSEDLKAADAALDSLMTTIRNQMKALTFLPDSQAANRRIGEIALQKFVDFDYSTSNGYAAGAEKVLNMKQEWTAQQADLTTLGIWPFIVAAATQAIVVLGLVDQRVDNDAARIVGLLKAAQAATNAAVKNFYDVVNAMNILESTEALTTFIDQLYSLEQRARLYYITRPSGNGGGGDNPDTPTVSAPVFYGETQFEESTEVTMTAEDGAIIVYTTDGSTPTGESEIYAEPLVLTETTTVKAMAIKDGITSDVTTRVYTKGSNVTPVQPENP